MAIQAGDKLRFGLPPPADRRIHNLQKAAEFPPRNHKVGDLPGAQNDGDRGQEIGFPKQQKIRGYHDLFRIETKLARDLLHRVNRSAVYVGLACFPQTTVTDIYFESPSQALQSGRPAVHRGSLYDFRNEYASPAQVHCAITVLRFVELFLGPASQLPALRITRLAGERVSISTSTEPGSPCCRGIREPEPESRVISTRMPPSRISLATFVTVAPTLPYSAHGKPSSRSRAFCPGLMRPKATGGSKLATTRSFPVGMTAASFSPSWTTPPTLSGATSPSFPSIGARINRRPTSSSKRCIVTPEVARSPRNLLSSPVSSSICAFLSSVRVRCSPSRRTTA